MTPAGNISNVGPVSFWSSLSATNWPRENCSVVCSKLGRVSPLSATVATVADLRPTGQLAGSEPFHSQPERHRPLADRQP